MWFTIALLVASMILSIVLAPKPPSNNMTPSDVNSPRTKEGVPIPVLFGCPRIKQPQVVWFGDIKTKAVKTKGGKK